MILTENQTIEEHPLQPFLPHETKILLLGSFPPPHARWSIEFFYPNFQNDMWRIMGWIFFQNKDHFIIRGEKRFDQEAIAAFCQSKGIALYDSASAVVRLQGNASDRFLEIVTPTDIEELLNRIAPCKTIAATGQKAAETIAERWGKKEPKVGERIDFVIGKQPVQLYRMPSSSRAYPLSVEKKAMFYRKMLEEVGIL